MSEGYLKITRSLSTNEAWLNARPEHQAIFITILLHCSFRDTIFDVFGQKEPVLIGQLLTSLRKLGDWTSKYTNKNEIVAALKYFSRHNFLRHKVRQGKTLITIIESDIYNTAFSTSQTESQTQVRQKPDTKKTVNTEKKTIDFDLIDARDPAFDLIFEHKKLGMIGIFKEDLIAEFENESCLRVEIECAIAKMIKQKPIIADTIQSYLKSILKNTKQENKKCSQTNQNQQKKKSENNLKNKSTTDNDYFLGDDLSETPLARSARLHGLK